MIEDHILPKLDRDFLDYFAGVQTRLGASKPGVASNPPIEDVRANPVAYQSPCALDASGYPGVSDFRCPSQDGVDIPVRVYHPEPTKHGSGPYPVHLNFHGRLLSALPAQLLTPSGGGFVLGDLTTEAALCLSMRQAGVAVVDVDYRLCPGTSTAPRPETR